MRIHDLHQGDIPSRSAALKKLLEHEIKLINEIRAKRQKLLNAQTDRNERILDRLGAPVKWIGYKSKKYKRFFAMN